MIIILIANIHHYGVKWGDSIHNLIKINSLSFTDFRGYLLIICKFLVIFLVVSRKKRIFAAEVLNIEGIDYEKYE